MGGVYLINATNVSCEASVDSCAMARFPGFTCIVLHVRHASSVLKIKIMSIGRTQRSYSHMVVLGPHTFVNQRL